MRRRCPVKSLPPSVIVTVTVFAHRGQSCATCVRPRAKTRECHTRSVTRVLWRVSQSCSDPFHPGPKTLPLFAEINRRMTARHRVELAERERSMRLHVIVARSDWPAARIGHDSQGWSRLAPRRLRVCPDDARPAPGDTARRGADSVRPIGTPAATWKRKGTVAISVERSMSDGAAVLEFGPPGESERRCFGGVLVSPSPTFSAKRTF